MSRTICVVSEGAPEVDDRPAAVAAPMRRLFVLGALVLIVAGGAAARFADLGTNPGGLYPDEAAEGLSARLILENHDYRPVFVPEDGGREALYAYSLAVGFGVGGQSIEVIRAVAAFWGVLGIIGVWLLVRRFGTAAGLAAAAWAAGSLWLIAISRDGMRNTISPLFGSISLLFLIAWVDRPSRTMAIIAGATCAITSLYTYNPLKMLAILAFLWILWLRYSDRPVYDRLARHAPAFMVSFAVLAAPMVLAAFQDPQAFFGRAIGVTVFNPSLVPEEDYVTHLVRTLGQFAFFGDPNPRHDVAGLPILGIPMAVVALIGIWVLWRGRSKPSHSLLLLAFPVFLLPQLIATEGGSPHFLRGLGLAAPIAVAVGLGAQELWDRLVATLTGRRWAAAAARGTATALLGGLLLAVGIGSATAYLLRPVADRYDPFTHDLVAMAELAVSGSDAVVADEFSAYTVSFVRRDVLIIRPGTSLADPTIQRVLARSVVELRAAVGEAAAGSAEPVAWDPAGQPRVWAAAVR
jgi:hypothetical protein